MEGDENTRFFHACANQRHRRNKIQVIEHDGCEMHNHDQKAAVLHAFYLNLLGSPTQTAWDFRLEDLYPEIAPGLNHIDAVFDKDEIHLAYKYMDSNASPGPDGFGPLFFKTMWAATSSDLLSLFSAFHSHTADIERLNRSYLVLLPKKAGARKPQDFRPIALQNSTIKGISKVLTNPLQPLIPSLIGTDQLGFVLGRCIADSFVYAAELLHCCHHRNAPTIVLKLDFHKAIDCVAWDSLDHIFTSSDAEVSRTNDATGWLTCSKLEKPSFFSTEFLGVGSIVARGFGKVTLSPHTCSSLLQMLSTTCCSNTL